MYYDTIWYIFTVFEIGQRIAVCDIVAHDVSQAFNANIIVLILLPLDPIVKSGLYKYPVSVAVMQTNIVMGCFLLTLCTFASF